jgi:hypothetical protein
MSPTRNRHTPDIVISATPNGGNRCAGSAKRLLRACTPRWRITTNETRQIETYDYL